METTTAPVTTYPFGPNHRLRQRDPSERLFRHKLHPEWGVGLWVREEQTRRRLRFDDGELRAFKKGFYHLLVPVDPEKVDVDEAFEKIGGDHARQVLERQEADSRKQRPPLMSFQEQLRVFGHLFPKGFEDPEFIDAHLRPVSGSARRAHLGHASDLAKDLLSKDKVQAWQKEGDVTALFDAALQVLGATSIVSPSNAIKPLEKLDDEAKKAFVDALADLLYGEGKQRQRMEDWLETLTGPVGLDKVTWGLATVFPALVHPDKHIAVKRNALELAARSVLPGVTLRRTPSARGYGKALRIARAVRRNLEDNDLHAPDLLHVRIFTWQTLRPKARDILDELLTGKR